MVVCSKIDKDGEYISESFVDALKNLTSEIIGEMRKEE